MSRFFLLLFLSFTPLLLPLLPLHAQDNDVYTIYDINVRTQHKNPVTAKKIAIQQAHSQAFQKILQKLLPPHLQNSIPIPKNIENFTKNITFLEEKSGDNLYLAKFNIQFNKNTILSYLQQHGFTPSFQTLQSLLIVPLYREVGSTRLWERNNLWLNAWTQHHNTTASGINILIPQGSSQDRQTLSSHNATSVNTQKLLQLAHNYQTENFILSTATMNTDINNQSINIRFQVLPFIVGTPLESYHFTEKTSSLQELPLTMKNATQKVINHISSLWIKRQQENKTPPLSSFQRTYWLVVPFTSNHNLQSITSRLTSIENFSSLKRLAANAEKALFSLSSSYNTDRIITILAQHRIIATPNPSHPHLLMLSQKG